MKAVIFMTLTYLLCLGGTFASLIIVGKYFNDVDAPLPIRICVVIAFIGTFFCGVLITKIRAWIEGS